MGQNQIGCISNRWETDNLRVRIEEGWLEQMESYREKDEKRHSKPNGTSPRSSWIANNTFSSLSIPERGSAVEKKLLQIFEISIMENRKRLCNTEYMRNIFLQTRQFEDKSAERDLENQEVASACSKAYSKVLGELWDAYQCEGSFQRANHRQLLRGYFAIFERHGRRLVAEGIAMGSAFIAREMGFSKAEEIEKYGKWLQVVLREKQEAAIESSYQRYLKQKSNEMLFDTIFERLNPNESGHVTRENFLRAWTSALAGAITVRAMENHLKLQDPYAVCRAEAARRTDEDAKLERNDFEKDFPGQGGCVNAARTPTNSDSKQRTAM